jgi:SAM-dependent methyltransferase
MTMLKYVGVAIALKSFSLYPPLYRLLGNTFGARRRMQSNLPPFRLRRAKAMVDLCKRYQVKSGDRLIELGTGWVHWESLIVRLFCDAETVLYDVWDNRQLTVFKWYCKQLNEVIDDHIDMTPDEHQRAHRILSQIAAVNSYDELYEWLNWKYVVDASGTLRGFADNSFDLSYSHNVAEHIQAEIVPEYVKTIYRITKPGGITAHSIDPTDHLANYTTGVSRKNYLRYSKRVWKLFFENRVQYINLIQPSDWLRYFEAAGFELVDSNSTYERMDIKVHKQYAELSPKDIDCMRLNIVYKKPADGCSAEFRTDPGRSSNNNVA